MMERFISLMKRLMLRRKPLLQAFVWVLFMCFFTYTTLFVELLKVDGDFPRLFYDEQSTFLALYVNVGLIVMLMFDNHVANKIFRGNYMPFMGLLVVLLLLGHCNLVKSGEYLKYVSPLSEKWLSYAIYVAFLFILYVMKVKSLLPEEIKVKKELN